MYTPKPLCCSLLSTGTSLKVNTIVIQCVQYVFNGMGYFTVFVLDKNGIICTYISLVQDTCVRFIHMVCSYRSFILIVGFHIALPTIQCWLGLAMCKASTKRSL